VEYILPQSFLLEKQLKTIEKASMPKLYAKCGLNRNTSRAVLAGPIDLGGGGFTPLYVTAGTGCVTHFLNIWRTSAEDIGKQLQIVYAWTSYQAGVSYPILVGSRSFWIFWLRCGGARQGKLLKIRLKY
jgi:hypothetical protein